MCLHVQNFLRSGGTLEDLKNSLGISYRENSKLGVVSLNYSQILSPASNPIVQECRALVLEIGTWNIMSWPLKRFFNAGEGHIPKDFDWSDFKTYEKLDGSLIHFWHHPEEGWQCGTRSVPDAETGLDDTGMTFKELVLKTMKEMGTNWDEVCASLTPGYTFVCELTTPENQVVVEYPDRKLTLLAVRNLTTLKELPLDEVGATPFPVVKLYPGFSLDMVKAEVGGRDPKKHEGFVLVDRNFNRVKIKSEAYVFMSSRKDSLQKSNKARVELILTDGADDVLPTLPAYIQEKIRDLQDRIRVKVSEIDQMWEKVRHIEDQREFALAVQHSGLSTPMFSIRKGKAKDGLDFLKGISPKRVLEYISVEEE